MPTPSNVLLVPVDDLAEHEIAALRNGISDMLARFQTGSTDSSAVCGWTTPLAAQLLQRLLAANRPVQASVLIRQAHNGGRCDRETVYRYGHFDQSRSLTGFTKPVSRIMRTMQAERLLPLDAADPMKPIYDAQNASFQKAQGFQMPAELVPIFASALPMPEAP